jgi:hypothetical protein
LALAGLELLVLEQAVVIPFSVHSQHLLAVVVVVRQHCILAQLAVLVVEGLLTLIQRVLALRGKEIMVVQAVKILLMLAVVVAGQALLVVMVLRVQVRQQVALAVRVQQAA